MGVPTVFRRLLSLLLLLAIDLGLFAGPHPCHARQARPQVAKMSCHMQMETAGPATGPSFSAAGGHDCCKTNHGTLCENVCQMTAVAQTEPVVFRIAPVARAVVQTSRSELSLFAQEIDHIPLA